MKLKANTENKDNTLTSYLNIIEVWALSIGCAVGWGAFVMNGTTFLPLAGPWGTAIGMFIGAGIMLLIGVNYHFLMNKYPDAGGTMTYSIRAFGFDHGLLSSWFLILVYIAIMWANATAIVLIVRNLFGSILQWGFHYQVAGYDVFGGEVLLTLAVILLFGFICMYSKRLAVVIQTVMAVLLVCGVIVCAAAVLYKNVGFTALTPAFSPSGKSNILQIVNTIVLMPWAFVGFESISNSTQGFKFSPKKSIWIMLAALLAGTVCYVLLVFAAAADYPERYSSWSEYVEDLNNLEGYESIPTFYTISQAMGKPGLTILGIAVLGGIVTGLVGNIIAASRLMYSMTQDGVLPEWFGRLDKKGNPSNAIMFLILISLFVPFIGRAAIGWIVDVNTIGALIAYLYTSAAAFKLAKNEKNLKITITGIAGMIISLLFFIYFMVPNIWTVSNLPAESYLILIVWSVLGFLFFRMVFSHDKLGRFGKTTTVWIVLLFLILFTSVLWFRQTAENTTKQAISDLYSYNNTELYEHGIVPDEDETAETSEYLQQKMEEVNKEMVSNSIMQMAVVVAALLIMFSIYKFITEREKEHIRIRVLAEERNRAKSTFLSNMSHDIRTPMNAIIGYTNLAKKEKDIDKINEYLQKIETSNQHLLALINDVLDMSRIESGKMELMIERTDIAGLLDSVRDMFSTQMTSKSIHYEVNNSDVTNRLVMCDAPHLNRVLLNLVSNAYKFTPEGGRVIVTLTQTGTSEDTASYELRVKDTGMGMSKEFAETVFEAYSREKTVSNIQGTGLGMAITKSIVDMMGGTIKVHSEQGKGTEFVLTFDFPLAEEIPEEKGSASKVLESMDFTGTKLLLVEDNEINRQIAELILMESGFELSTAENGKEAYEIIANSQPGDYQAVLMDVQMPVMNGYEATKAIRALKNKELAQIPIIAMTANAFVEDIQAAHDAGMDGHIAKPIDIPSMMQQLACVIFGNTKE